MNLIEEFKAGKLDPFRILNGFIVFLDKLGKNPKSIKVWISVITGLFRHGGFKIYAEDIRKTVKIPRGHRQREEPLTKEILVRLLRNSPIKIQTAILVAIASGMRIGEIVQIRISDVDFGSRPTKIKIRSEITKTRESRETYLTAEATNALKDYLVRFFGWKEGERNESLMDKTIFGRTSSKGDYNQNKETWKPRKRLNELRCTPVFVAESSLANSLKRHIRNIPELNKINENGRRVIHFHAFRKYFRTVAGDATNRDFAEALMGHHFYLDTYYLQTEEKRRELYLKAEPYLTISDFAQVEKNLNKMAEKQSELEEEQRVLKQFIAKHFVGLS
ncbi:MAG: tyrosine-type recombinase/integrase [Rhabdochlamydiaceae bacterium]